MLANIPAELRAYKQFVCWRYEVVPDRKKPVKMPLNPRTGGNAQPNNPATWSDYDTAMAVYNAGYVDGIGFMLTPNDPYVFIDLDEPDESFTDEHKAEIAKIHNKIYNSFPSYAEISPSGKGLHIIAKGSVPEGKNKREVATEVYSGYRFMTMTGNVYRNAPIIDANPDYLRSLWEELGGLKVNGFSLSINTAQVRSDQDIFALASSAKNGEKFLSLWNGNWAGLYPSQSEADEAICNMIAFYTQNQDQIIRVFLASALGKRVKAHRADYQKRLLKRALDNAIKPIDFSAFYTAVNAYLGTIYERQRQEEAERIATIQRAREQVQAAIPLPKPASEPMPAGMLLLRNGEDFPVPPGLMGAIASFVYQQSPYPAPRISLSAAIGFMSGLCGRAFNLNGFGMNTYTVLVADTSAGKEAISSGISKLVDATAKHVPAIRPYFGVGNIASGQALYRQIKERKCFLTIQGEFGKRLAEMTGPRANAVMHRLSEAYLALYTKSGASHTLGADVFADKERDTSELKSPALSILAETAPPHLYDCLDETMLSDGFLPRFTLIEQEGVGMTYQPDAHRVAPGADLIGMVVRLADAAIKCDTNGAVVDIALDEEAAGISENYRATCREIVAKGNRESIKQLWSRAHVKVLKLAGLVAIGNWAANGGSRPVITAQCIEWAMLVVNDGTRRLVERFANGSIGDGDERAMADAISFLRRYLYGDVETLPQAHLNRRLQAQGYINYMYFRNNIASKTAFKHGIGGSSQTVMRVCHGLLSGGLLTELDATAVGQLGVSGKVYRIKLD